jgi:hypothetical protein
MVGSAVLDLNSGNNSNATVTIVARPNAPPAHLGTTGQTNGLFRFLVNGQIGDSFVIEAASDPAGPWTPILTNTLTSVPWLFQDPNSAAYNRRFYRARSR